MDTDYLDRPVRGDVGVMVRPRGSGYGNRVSQSVEVRDIEPWIPGIRCTGEAVATSEISPAQLNELGSMCWAICLMFALPLGAELGLQIEMPKKNFRRQSPRLIFFLAGFLLVFILAEVSSLFLPTASSQLQKKSDESVSLGTRNQTGSSAARSALMDLPLSFEPGARANQFFVRGSGYRLMLTASQAIIAVDKHAHEKILSMKLV